MDGSRRHHGILANPFRLIRSSLRAKLLLIFAVLTTIPLGVVGIVSYARSSSTIKENITDSATQMARQLTTNIELVFKDSEKFLKIGNHETAIRFLNPYRQSEDSTYRAALELIGLFKLFRDIYEFDTTIKGIYILGFNGNNISEQVGRFHLGRSLSSIPTVSRILSRAGEVCYIPNQNIDYAEDPGYGNVISVGKAIVRPSTRDILGVIIVDVDSAAIMELCRGVRMGETGYFSLVTEDARFIYPPDGEREAAGVSPAARRMIADYPSGNFVRSAGRTPEFFVFDTLKDAGWKVIGRVKLSEIMRGAYNIRSITVVVVVLCILFAIILYFFISDALTHPIRDLKEKMGLAESGNLEVRAESKNRDEIADLCHSFNVMIAKIKDLLERNIKEQEELKKSELKALQAQINPHFLYNTLDAIVWMTEAGKGEDVVKITKTLSSFFRIVLSKGEEWIRVHDEIEHVRAYLAIQKMRYRDILEYRLELEEEILENRVLKLTLQPIVENAIYHGIKNSRGGGLVTVTGRRLDSERMRFDVIDNGKGMSAERLRQVREALGGDLLESPREKGYGLMNVNQRIKLYYGKEWGMNVESVEDVGTHVTVVIPAVE